jgi:hypothetical protein
MQTVPQEQTRAAYQEAKAARNAAVKTLLDAAAKLRADSDDPNVVTIARSLEQTANTINARPVDQVESYTPEEDSPTTWLTLLIVFVIGVFVGRLLKSDTHER